MAPSISYSLKQKIFIVKRYYQGGNSVKIVQNDYLSEFRRTNSPTDDSILELVNMFEEFGTVVADKNEKEKIDNIEVVTERTLRLCKNVEYAEEKKEIIFNDDDSFSDIKNEPEFTCSSDNDNKSDIEHNQPEQNKEEDEYLPSDNEDPNLSNGELQTISRKKRGFYKCDECDKEFNRKKAYDRHLSFHRKRCKLCNKKYRNYDSHMGKHSGEKSFKCLQCGSSFSALSKLNLHMANHSDERPFPCTVCTKSFKTKELLRSHTKTHQIERPIKCDVCQKGFLFNGDLKKHSRIHTGEKPFVCSFCGRCFSTSTTLTVHNRIHTGEKPYKCSLCNKKFSSPGSLLTHTRIHNGERPYSCTFCGKTFYDTSTCKVHQRTHTGNYPYKCHLCGKAHNHPSNLKSHLKHAHQIE